MRSKSLIMYDARSIRPVTRFRVLWHLSDSERLGVFSARQLRSLAAALDFVEANCEEGLRDEKTRATMTAVRRNLERLLERPE